MRRGMVAMIGAILFGGLLASGSLAQAPPPPAALIVPKGECGTSCIPTDVEHCCVAEATTCSRVDGPAVVTAVGTPYVVSLAGSCSNCFGCPDDPPIGDLQCNIGASLTATQSASAAIEARVTVGIPGIEGSLSSTLGVQVGTSVQVHADCTMISPPCIHKTALVTLAVTAGKQAEIEHTWTLKGSWTNRFPSCPCPIATNPWSAFCGTGTSSGIATIVGNSTCSLTGQTGCDF